MTVESLAQWTPIRIHWEQGYPMLDWAYLGEQRFVEPFFDETVERLLRRPFGLLFRHQTPIAALGELEALTPGLPPTGFIFHMSRCGSTLVAQMLAALPQNIVIAEAGPVDAILRAHWRDPSVSDEQRIAWLRGLLSAYARPQVAGERHFFVKFDSWHTVALPLVQRAFPDVPWIFLYRDPVEVLVSHERQKGAQMVPGMLPPIWLGLEWHELAGIALDEYGARALARICTAALAHQNAHGRWIKYGQLPAAVVGELAAHFQLKFSPADIDRMQEKAQWDVKSYGMPFANDTARKQQAATPRLHQLADEWLTPLYEQMETQRSKETPCLSA